MLTVIKRDQSQEPFYIEKIFNAVKKAFTATTKSLINNNVIDSVVNSVVNVFEGWDTVAVEKIQDTVESVLMKLGYTDVAKAYILYRQKRAEVRAASNKGLQASDIIDSYIDKSDWRVRENANAGFSFASLISHCASTVIANYVLEQVYPKNIADAHRNGDMHIHDLGCGIVGYCAGWSLRDILEMGFKGVHGRAAAGPAKHFDSALLQLANFLCTLQTEWAGAQAVSSFDTLLAPFIRHDKLEYKEVEQRIQQFVFGLNVASRLGQCPFTNITLDWTVPDDLKDHPVIIGGEPHEEWVYGDFKPEMDMINEAFLRVMARGDHNGGIFTFPIPTYNITKEFIETELARDENGEIVSKNAKLLFEVTGKYGIPYFQNFVNSELNPSDVRSMCPLLGSTKLLVKSVSEEVNVRTLHDLYCCCKNTGDMEKYQVWTPTGWQRAKIVRMPTTAIYRIKISNGTYVDMGENHLQPIKGGETVTAKDLQVGQWIPFNKKPIDGDIGCYSLGYMDKHLYYTSAEQLREDITTTLSSLSKKELETYVDVLPGRLGEQPNYRIDYPESERYKDRYDEDENFLYYRINEIEVISNSDEYLYCVELNTPDHLFMLANGLMTHNCRLRLDKRELLNKTGGLFGAAEKTGSIGVVTINLPRIGYLSKTKEELFKTIDNNMELAKESLEIKRKLITRNMDSGLMPYSKIYLGNFNNHFSTIGLVGMNELCLNFLGKNIATEEGSALGIEVLNHMRKKLQEFQEETGNMYNLESSPAEATSYRLAKIDKEKHPDIITAGEDAPYYTNSSNLPVGFTDDLFTALDLQEGLQCCYTGGTVFHAFLGENVEQNVAAKMVQTVFEHYRIPYLTITPSFTICPVHGYIPGVHESCPYDEADD